MRDHEAIAAEIDGRNLLKGAAAGLIGGLVASWVMNQFQSIWSRLSSGGQGGGQQEQEQQQQGGERQWQQQQQQEENEPATTKVATAVSQRVFHHRLSQQAKKVAEPAVHYAFGTAMGGLYGALVEMVPAVESGFGLLYATLLWAAADELALPSLGLSKGPTEYPLSSHVYGLVSHWVYGLTAEAVRRAVRAAL